MGSIDRVLPPHIDENIFVEILNGLAKIVGKENVSSDEPSKLGGYSDVYAFDENRDAKPSAAVRPSCVEEVQAIVRLANQYKFPLWTVSRGKNWGYGASAPVVEGSIVLDLSRMSKVIEMNEDLCYAIVEPGVSFFQIFEHARSNGLKVWPSMAGLGQGSVLGNTLERGLGYTANGEHAREQCGMEVVLPDGELMRTGMGAMDNNKCWPLYKGGFGPDVEGLFFQSGLGVVTKLGIHCAPQPESYMTCEAHVPNEEDLPMLVDIASDLTRRKIIQNHPIVFNPFRRIVANEDPSIRAQIFPLMGKPGAIPEDSLNEISARNGLGYWGVVFAFYGPEELVTASWKYAQKAFSTIKGAGFQHTMTVGKNGALVRQEDIPDEHIPMNGVPNLKALSLMDYRGKPGGHTCFAPTLPCSGKEIYEWHLKTKSLVQASGFDYFTDFQLFGRHAICLLLLIYGPHEKKKMTTALQSLMDEMAASGYAEYRTHSMLQQQVANHFKFNDGALNKYLTTLKDVTDPNGILSPGKAGIWGTVRAKQNSKLT